MKTLWISGWASNFLIWNKEIQSLPGHHDRLSWLSILENPEKAFSDLDHYERIVAWSLGSLLLMNWIEKCGDTPPIDIKSTKIILHSPIHDFCDEHNGWHPRVLNRMIKGIQNNPQIVLQDFLKGMGETQSTSSHAWLKSAMSFSKKDLCLGLEALQNKQWNIQNSIWKSLQLDLIHGTQDTIVQIAQARVIAEQTKAHLYEHHGGHLVHWPSLQKLFS